MNSYHSLLVKVGGVWSVEFGDYDIQEVREERDAWREAGIMMKHTKIITTENTQAAINARVAELNKAK